MICTMLAVAVLVAHSIYLLARTGDFEAQIKLLEARAVRAEKLLNVLRHKSK
jgi:hypothetical protein